MRKLRIHKATSAKGIVTECGLLIEYLKLPDRDGPRRKRALMWTTDWSGVRCGNCERTRVQSSKTRANPFNRLWQEFLKSAHYERWGGHR